MKNMKKYIEMHDELLPSGASEETTFFQPSLRGTKQSPALPFLQMASRYDERLQVIRKQILIAINQHQCKQQKKQVSPGKL
jgi:DUF1365 family protein